MASSPASVSLEQRSSPAAFHTSGMESSRGCLSESSHECRVASSHCQELSEELLLQGRRVDLSRREHQLEPLREGA
eukprot:6475823-Amphidinium_carterae.2